jgi:hypothetical protein
MRWAVLAGAVFVLGSGVAGYLLGQSSAPTVGEAERSRVAAYDSALNQAKGEASERARMRGRKRGMAKGLQAGKHEGLDAGGEAGVSQAEQELAALTPQPTAEPVTEPPPVEEPLICDGAIANDAHYQACLEQAQPPAP